MNPSKPVWLALERRAADRMGMPTVPQRLRDALTGAPAKSLKELSSELSVPEKELAFALEKLAQSLRHQALVLGREAAGCLECGFEFESRGRVTKPSRCPSCKSERIRPPRFWIFHSPGTS